VTLRSNVFCIPFAAPSTAGFVEISPKGRGMDAARQQEGRKPSLLTPDKIEERKDEAVIGPPFLWILAFGGAKESISPSGARTRSTICRDSDTSLTYFQSAEIVCVTSVNLSR